MMKTASLIAAVGLAGVVQAQVVVPSVPSNGAGLSTPVRALPRSIAMFYAASNFSAVSAPNNQLNSIAFRLSDPVNNPGLGASWPAANINFSDYTIVIGSPSAGVLGAAGGAQFPTTGGTYSQWIDNPVTVRSGPLTIPANSFANNGPGASFQVPINFSTNYTLPANQGVVVFITHSGFGGSDNVFFDVTGFTAGVCDTIYSTTNLQSPEIFGDVPIVRFGTIPAPSSLALLGLGGLAAMRRRR